MVLLKLCIAIVVVSCLGSWCQGEDQPEVELLSREAPITSIQPRRKSSNIQEAKRHRHKTPNVHIENIFVPQRTKNSDNSNQGSPYHVNPIIPQYYTFHEDSEIVEKPNKVVTKPMPSQSAEPHKPDSITQKLPVIFSSVNAEQDNEYIALPSAFLNQPNFLNTMLSSTGGRNPYFLIINSPQSGQNIPKLSSSLSPEAVKENEDKVVEVVDQPAKPLNIQPQLNPSRSSPPYVKVSQQYLDNLGLSVAKYLLGQSLQSVNDMEYARAQKTELSVKNENFKDSVNQEVFEVATDDDFITEADELTTKDVKLPLDFILGIERPQKKVDDRVALIYLRHTKKGRNMQLADQSFSGIGL